MDSTIKVRWGDKPIEEIECYLILNFFDKSKPLEIHRPNCGHVGKLSLTQRDKTIPDFKSHLSGGTLEEAEAWATRIVSEENRPSGWKRAECCFK